MGADITEIVREVSTDLSRKLKDEGEKVSTNTVNIIVKAIVREFIQKREYPDTMSDEEVLADLEKYYATMLRLAEYDYNMIGAEGQTSHSENGVSRQFVDRNSFFNDVYKYVRIF